MVLLLQHLVLGRLVSKMGSKKIGMMLAHIKKEDLVVMKKMMETGKVVPVVDRCYPLSQVPEAYKYLESRRARGKIVVIVKDNTNLQETPHEIHARNVNSLPRACCGVRHRALHSHDRQ